MTTRRGFLRLAAVGAVPLVVAAQDSAPPVRDTTSTADRLRMPDAIGRPQDSLTPLENDPVVVAIERKLKCTCGCTLDIYTCRTTDFTCTFSPALHQEVMAMVGDGQTPEQIIAAFVAREGPQILMAPPPEGFNLAGYLVPGLAMLTAALGLVAWVSRRRQVVASDRIATMIDRVAPPAHDPVAEERLRRALDDVDA